MKIIRKPIEAPTPTAEATSPTPDMTFETLTAVAMSTNDMVAKVAQASERITEKLQEATAGKKPTSYRCVITERDEQGRMLAFDIVAK